MDTQILIQKYINGMLELDTSNFSDINKLKYAELKILLNDLVIGMNDLFIKVEKIKRGEK